MPAAIIHRISSLFIDITKRGIHIWLVSLLERKLHVQKLKSLPLPLTPATPILGNYWQPQVSKVLLPSAPLLISFEKNIYIY
jgi:hypothetical protein